MTFCSPANKPKPSLLHSVWWYHTRPWIASCWPGAGSFYAQSGSKHKRSHQRERDFWLACADALLAEAFDTLKTLVFDKLDSIIRASSLVEMVNSLLHPSQNSCKGYITQETLNLIMFYHNHRRYKSGKRQGKAPIELLTGKPLEAPWWELLRQQINTKRAATAPGTGLSRPPLQLVVNNDGVYGSTGDCFRTNDRRLDRRYGERLPTQGF